MHTKGCEVQQTIIWTIKIIGRLNCAYIKKPCPHNLFLKTVDWEIAQNKS